MFLHWQSKYVSSMLQKLIKQYDCTQDFHFCFLHSYPCVGPKNNCLDKMVAEIFNPFFCQCWVSQNFFCSSSKEIILNSGTTMIALGITLYLMEKKYSKWRFWIFLHLFWVISPVLYCISQNLFNFCCWVMTWLFRSVVLKRSAEL